MPNLGAGLFAVGVAEAASNVAGDSLVDRAGKVTIATTPLPVVEQTIKYLGVTDKPFLRANLALAGASLVGLALPKQSLGRQLMLAGAGLVAAGLGRRYLDALEDDAASDFPRPVAEPLGPISDGAEQWQDAEPLVTEPERFYVTDINLRPPAIDVTTWSLKVSTPSEERHLAIEDLTGLGLQERDAALVCVHNRPGWDRLGQQRWTGVSIEEVLAAADAFPEDPGATDLVMEAADGYTQVIPLSEAIERRSWLVVGMAGRPLPRAQGYPARVMTPGLVGQYNGVKWLSALRLVPAGSEPAWWVRRGWPLELVEVPPMARIDHPANTGMPPRLPPPPIEVAAGQAAFVGTAWAPPHGVAAVEVRLDDGEWREVELAGEINGDSWRRWRTTIDLTAGTHHVETRCHSRSGAIQAGEPTEPFPHGSGAYHRVDLTAT